MNNGFAIARTAAPLRQEVVRLIREDILNGVLTPGQRLVENALCASYSVSRTVVREALRQLESERLIEVRPSLGPQVAVLDEADIQALYVVRAALEALVGKLFAQHASAAQCAALALLRDRLDEDYRRGTVESREAFKAAFYARLAEGAQNAVLSEHLRAMHARVTMFRRFAFVDPDRTELSIRQLAAIIRSAAIDRDPKAAWAECERHILTAGEMALAEFRKRGLGRPR